MTPFTIILDHIGVHEVAVKLRNGVLVDMLVDPVDAPRLGTIYRAVCDRPIKGAGGMFVRLPGGTGFLRRARGLKPGDRVNVQVTGFAEAGKALPVTDRVLFKSRHVIISPHAPGKNISRAIRDDDRVDELRALLAEVDTGEMGLILRSICAEASDDDILDDLADTLEMAQSKMTLKGDDIALLHEGDGPHNAAWRDWAEPADIITKPGGLAREGALDAIAALGSGHISLGEGEMSVEATNALVAIDVNTKGDFSGAAALKANLAAARAIPQALRLRGFGGQIVVDFAPVSKTHRKQVEQALRAAFKTDGIETAMIGWTQMGLYELQRKRERALTDHVVKEVG